MVAKPNTAVGGSLLASVALKKELPQWFVLALCLLAAIPAQSTELRIAIKKGVSQVKIGSSTPAIVRDEAGRKLGELGEMNAFLAQTQGSRVAIGQWQGSQLSIEPTGEGYVWIGNTWYRGSTRLIRQGQGLIAINRVDIEQYLYSVVGAEAIATWPQEALKTQAVAARTYALYKSATSGNRFYDLDTTTSTQVYKGLSSEYISTHDAVDNTQGQVMTYNGKVILAVFHSASGGHTENVEDVWSSRLPYLRGVVDYDQQSPVFEWTKFFSSSQLSRLISGIGNVRSLIPERTTPLGRVLSMRVVGDRGSKKITGTQLRKALDLRSTLVTVSADNGTFQILGRGYGHGIGLSQWGTYYLAQQGVNYQQILTHYYQNARLTSLLAQHSPHEIAAATDPASSSGSGIIEPEF
jgi:stage II sporulation protein D